MAQLKKQQLEFKGEKTGSEIKKKRKSEIKGEVIKRKLGSESGVVPRWDQEGEGYRKWDQRVVWC